MQIQEIRKRKLGKTGLSVTEIGVGLWAAGGDAWGKTEDGKILSAIDHALDYGVNFYDTSDVYGDGHSEELLGQAMIGRRDKFIVATKIGWKGFDHSNCRSAYNTVGKVVEGVEFNLKRLKTDTIDIIQNHINVREPNMEIMLEGFQKLKKQGKIKAYGVSTSDLNYLKAFTEAGGCDTLQIDYSILNRTAEKDIFPYCRKKNIGIIIRGALAMGILSGKMHPNSRFEEGDFRKNWLTDPEQYNIFKNDLEKMEILKHLAEDQTPAELALRFVLSNPDISTVIPGMKSPNQVKINVNAGFYPPIDIKLLKKLDLITPHSGGRKIWPA